jgi:peptidoglycan hydrolase-like protein with peptidoglycan-binding domain
MQAASNSVWNTKEVIDDIAQQIEDDSLTLTYQQGSVLCSFLTPKSEALANFNHSPEAVALVQALLNLCSTAVKVDGEYGQQTKHAVQKFQGESVGKITRDASIGTRTVAALLHSAQGLQFADSTQAYRFNIARPLLENLAHYETLYDTETGKGTLGDKTKSLQIILKELGYYDGPIHGKSSKRKSPETQEALKLFQKDRRIAVDGKPGPDTIQNILAAYLVEGILESKENS